MNLINTSTVYLHRKIICFFLIGSSLNRWETGVCIDQFFRSIFLTPPPFLKFPKQTQKLWQLSLGLEPREISFLGDLPH